MAHRPYKATGTYSQGTVLVLETAAGDEQREPGLKGSYQRGFTGFSAAVEDAERFEGGWGYFQFGGADHPKSKAQPAKKAACYGCHRQKAADDKLLTQVYPVLRAASP
jgi:hypothetical protein